MAKSKATKRFEKKHLTDVLKRRKEFAKVKQRHQIQAKKKARRAEDAEYENGKPTDDEKQSVKKAKPAKTSFDDITVDDFFAGGLPSHTKKTNGTTGTTKRSGKRKRVEDEGSDDESSVASVEEHAIAYSSGSEHDDQEDGIESHKEDLKGLASKDPEFYKYLKENDAELLDFDEDADLGEIDELSESEAELESKAGEKKKRSSQTKAATSHRIDKALVKKWSTSMSTTHSLRAARELVLAFRAAAHLNEENGKEYKYTIADAEVYHEVLSCALRQIPQVLQHHLPVKNLPNGKIRVSTDSKKYRTLTSLLKSHTAAVQHLLENLADAGTLKLTLTSLLDLLPYTLSFKKLLRNLNRSVVEIWADTSQAEATRIHAFLVIRRLTVIGDPSIKESILRTVYQGLVKGSRTTTVHNLAGINLLKNSAAELWGLVEPSVAYTTAFTSIRQLAIHLRNSIKHNANDSYKAVYNWQFVHSLDFWSRVLSTQCDTLHEAMQPVAGKKGNAGTAGSQLRQLIYPVVQVTLGAMRLIPTPAYFPLRFHLTHSLLRLSRTTNTFIPLAAPLFEVLNSAELKNSAKPSTLAPVDFTTSLRVGKSYLRTRVYQEGAAEQVIELLGEFFALWCKSVAFPELALPVIVMLRRWVKSVNKQGGGGHHTNGRAGKKAKPKHRGGSHGKIIASVSLLVQKLESNSAWIEQRRRTIDFAPTNRAGVEAFLKDVEWTTTPLGAFIDGQRKAREQRTKLIEQGRIQEEKSRRKEKAEQATKNADGFDSDDDEEEDEEEEEVELDEEDEEMED